MKLKNRGDYRKRRHMRVRKKIRGTAERPRMSIMVSDRNMYVQFIDDDSGLTLASATTVGADGGKNIAAAVQLGRNAAGKALKKDIKNVTVDRGGYKFHGRVKAIVNAAVEAGLVIGRQKRAVRVSNKEG